MTEKIGFDAVLGILAAAIALLIVLVPLPPLVDYPNHLARLWLLAGSVHTPPLDRFYLESWHHITTNIAVDLAAKALTWLVPADVVGKLMILLAAALPVGGTIALNRSVMGTCRPWTVFFPLFWCPLTFLYGFLNFEIALGIALIGAACDGALRRCGGWRLHGGRVGWAVLAFVAHPFGLLFYCAMLAAIGFGRAPVTHRTWRPRLVESVKAAWICVAVLALYYAWQHVTPALSGADPADTLWWPFQARLAAWMTPLAGYYVNADRLVALGLAGWILVCLLRGRIEVHAGLALTAAVFLVASILVPFQIGSASFLPFRLALIGWLALLVGSRVELRPGRWVIPAAAAMLLVTLRTASVAEVWTRAIPMANAVARAAVAVPPGAAVFAMRTEAPPRRFLHLDATEDARIPYYRHFGALLVPKAHAFYPGLFAMPGMQPLVIRRPFDKLAEMGGGDLLPVAILNEPGQPLRKVTLVRQWRTGFDYMLLICPRGCAGNDLAIRDLRLIRDEGSVRLYRVVKEDKPRARLSGPR